MVRLHPLCHTACHRMVCVSHWLLSQLTAWPNISFVVRFVNICVFLIVIWIFNELPFLLFLDCFAPPAGEKCQIFIFCGSLDLIYTYFLLPLLCTVCNFSFCPMLSNVFTHCIVFFK